jgi:hypothetical protein
MGMIKTAIAALAVAASFVAVSAPANAASIRYNVGSFYNPGNVAPGVTLDESFDGFALGRVTGGFIRSGDTSAVADPLRTSLTDRYLEVRSNLDPAQPFVFNFSGERKVFAFDVRDVRANSELRVTLSDNSVQTFVGSAILGLQSLPAVSSAGRVRFNLAGGLGATSIAFFSPNDVLGSRWAVDNIASAVPEPATWGMLILGFGFAGSALRTRRNVAA